MHIKKGGSAFKYQVTIDPEMAIEFLKSVGFEATGDPDLFRRAERRSRRNTVFAQRYWLTVSFKELSGNPTLWRAFVRRNAPFAKKLQRDRCPLCGGPWKRAAARRSAGK